VSDTAVRPSQRDYRGMRARQYPRTALRWALVPVAAFAVWFGTLLLGIAGSSLLDSLCPPDLMISGICTATWHGPAMKALEIVCAAIAAVGFIALPAAIAPAYHIPVAVGCFVVGGLLTIELAIAGALWAPAAVAAVAGVTTLWSTISRSRRRRSRISAPSLSTTARDR
jgi:hypothetical protein